MKNTVHAMVKSEEHACCSKSKAPDIFSSDVDWELSGVGLALRNWDSAYNSEGGRFGVNAASAFGNILLLSLRC